MSPRQPDTAIWGLAAGAYAVTSEITRRIVSKCTRIRSGYRTDLNKDRRAAASRGVYAVTRTVVSPSPSIR